MLYCIVLCCVVSCCIVLCRVVSCRVVLCRVVLCCVVLCRFVLCCVVLFCIVSCCVVLYCVVSCCVVLCCTVQPLCKEHNGFYCARKYASCFQLLEQWRRISVLLTDIYPRLPSVSLTFVLVQKL